MTDMLTLTPDEFIARFAPAPPPAGMLCMAADRLTSNSQLSGSFAVTEKLDGVRCLAVKRGDSVQLLTRSGNPINGAEEVRESIARLPADMILDGELIAAPKPGESRKQTYERTRSDVQAGRCGLIFHAFDVLTLSEFDSRTCCHPYFRRRQLLDAIADRFTSASSALQIVPVLYTGDDAAQPWKLMESICAQGGEGVMVNRLESVYQFRRCGDLLKLKPHKDADLRVLDVIEGTGKNAGRAGCIVVDYKGFRVGVSSGMSAKLREAVWNNRNLYIGRIAKVRYAEESQNSNGGLSLRFPVFVEFREPGKQVSYA